MGIADSIEKDIVVAMKARDEHRLTTLRMVKSALKNKEIDKREPLTEAEEAQTLTTLIKQRKESVESFTKGGRPELAEKEQAEIGMIEGYLPAAAGEDEVRTVVMGAIAHMAAGAGSEQAGTEGYGAGDERGEATAAGQRDAGGWQDGERDGEGGVGEWVGRVSPGA